MSFYDNLKSLCEEKGLSITKTVEICGGSTGSIGGWKAGKWPNSEIVFKIATRLDVSCDRLLMGQEAKKAPVPELSENERDMLKYFKQLTEREQAILIGEARALAMFDEIASNPPEVASSGGKAV